MLYHCHSQDLLLSIFIFTQANPELTLSSVKRSEDGKALLARFYNTTSTEQELKISGAKVIAGRTMAEKRIEQGFDCVKPFAVATVELETASGA